MPDAVEALTEDYNHQHQKAVAEVAALSPEERECLEDGLEHALAAFNKVAKTSPEAKQYIHKLPPSDRRELVFEPIAAGRHDVYVHTAGEKEKTEELDIKIAPYKVFSDEALPPSCPVEDEHAVREIGFRVFADHRNGSIELGIEALHFDAPNYTRKWLSEAEGFIKFADDIVGRQPQEHQPFIHSNIGLGQE